MKPVTRNFITALISASLPFAADICTSRAEQQPAVPSLLAETNSFPDANEVLKGHLFRSFFDRDVFFLRKIRADYSDSWPPLLNENIVLKDYVQSPDKLLRFVQELEIGRA